MFCVITELVTETLLPVECTPLTVKFLIVTPEIERLPPATTLSPEHELQLDPLIVSEPAPGPKMDKVLSTPGNSVSGEIVPVAVMLIASPGAAVSRALRRVPGPESAVLVTV